MKNVYDDISKNHEETKKMQDEIDKMLNSLKNDEAHKRISKMQDKASKDLDDLFKDWE